jgi:hypothetical protein
VNQKKVSHILIYDNPSLLTALSPPGTSLRAQVVLEAPVLTKLMAIFLGIGKKHENTPTKLVYVLKTQCLKNSMYSTHL